MAARQLCCRRRAGEASRESESAFRLALTDWCETGKSEGGEVASVLSGLASLYLAQERVKKAAEVLDRAFAALADAPGAAPADHLKLLRLRAAVERHQGEWRRAAEDLQQAMNLTLVQREPDSSVLAAMMAEYAEVLGANIDGEKLGLSEKRGLLRFAPFPRQMESWMQPNFSNPPARESGEEQLGPVSNGNSPGSLACSSDSGIRIDSSSYPDRRWLDIQNGQRRFRNVALLRWSNPQSTAHRLPDQMSGSPTHQSAFPSPTARCGDRRAADRRSALLGYAPGLRLRHPKTGSFSVELRGVDAGDFL